MMERGASQDETIDVGYSHANGHATAEGLEHAACGAAVQIQRVTRSAVVGGDHVRLAFDTETDVADKSGVENLVNGLVVVVAALWQALYLGALGRLKFAHFPILTG